MLSENGEVAKFKERFSEMDTEDFSEFNGLVGSMKAVSESIKGIDKSPKK